MYLFLSILMLSCAQFGSQIFLPALPQIAEQFSLSNTDTQQIIMLYAIGFGLSQLLYGPWSDIAGRRKIFLFGQLLLSPAASAVRWQVHQLCWLSANSSRPGCRCTTDR